MHRPYGILLIPHTTHRHQILSTGKCGSRPPTAYYQQDRWHPNSGTIDPDGDALVLGWDRNVLHPGCLAARWTQLPETVRLVSRALSEERGFLFDLAQHLASVGTVVTLGIQRQEVRRLEVPQEVACG